MLHAASDTGTDLWTPDAERVPVGDSRQILSSYLNEWKQIASELGGEARLLDEEFVGGTGPGMPQGTVIPRSSEYFHRFYDARAAFGTYVQALCMVKTPDGKCASHAGSLAPIGAWPEPENQDLFHAIVTLETYLTLGTSFGVSSLVPAKRSKGPMIAAAVGVLGMGALLAGIVKAARHR